MTLPILYSLRNCPFAMRARLAIFRTKQAVELRDIVLSNKPTEMLLASPKATVPVLVVTPDKVIDESLEVMLWVLNQSDPSNLLRSQFTDKNKQVESSVSSVLSKELEDILALVHVFDTEFKTCLEQYKCAKRYHEDDLQQKREACEMYIKALEQRLSSHAYLIDDDESLADIALLPFIRQFARVERKWYLQSSYPNVKRWLNRYLQSAMFTKVMAKYPLWQAGQPIVKFGDI
ncbi:glutathione S-transferase [Psychrosphaera sp. 1_MG-2023]|uniref:glutathione S-transferase n=1 Tax=Psychrosphaera sp. 1_MG-2023 TaxID=3062643 RepID=UPI0026E231B3|nr:glutathione S-transferase [Psychrosphaera sp. 1_MG-2023]MDO6721498.1 glutathione S-transferase [Psychrosphaera sp. 1_MG-2023]